MVRQLKMPIAIPRCVPMHALSRTYTYPSAAAMASGNGAPHATMVALINHDCKAWLSSAEGEFMSICGKDSSIGHPRCKGPCFKSAPATGHRASEHLAASASSRAWRSLAANCLVLARPPPPPRRREAWQSAAMVALEGIASALGAQCSSVDELLNFQSFVVQLTPDKLASTNAMKEAARTASRVAQQIEA